MKECHADFQSGVLIRPAPKAKPEGSAAFFPGSANAAVVQTAVRPKVHVPIASQGLPEDLLVNVAETLVAISNCAAQTATAAIAMA